MASTSQRYPLSTPDGDSIPLDIIRPHSYLFIDFTLSASASIAVPAGVEIMSVSATTDCFIKFGGTAAAPVAGVLSSDLCLVEADMRTSIAPTASTFTVIGDMASGKLRIQFIDKWAGLALQTQYVRT